MTGGLATPVIVTPAPEAPLHITTVVSWVSPWREPSATSSNTSRASWTVWCPDPRHTLGVLPAAPAMFQPAIPVLTTPATTTALVQTADHPRPLWWSSSPRAPAAPATRTVSVTTCSITLVRGTVTLPGPGATPRTGGATLPMRSMEGG